MYGSVANSLDEIRLDFEARCILKELERLKSLPENQKHRFIWELIQNAKDCARPNVPVNISINLEKDRFIFAHNGLEFRVKDLIALARRGSTKVHDESRLGTGFIKTHVLNKVVTIKGQVTTPRGFRDFKLILKRTADNLSDMKRLLEETYQLIIDLTHPHSEIFDSSGRKISPSSSPSLSGSSSTLAGYSSFEYHLDPESYSIAHSALEDLKRNIIFTLVVNESIESITININGSQNKYALRRKSVYKKIVRAKVLGITHSMLIRHFDSFGITLGINCTKTGSNDYFLTQIPNQTKVFKDFPLTGTEDFHCAPLIQSSHWCPNDFKDGIRIKKSLESDIDPIADTNRSILCAYRDHWITFIQELIELQVLNRYILAISGLPRYSNRYSDNLWFRREIQLPLRQFIRSQDLVRNTKCTDELYFYSRIDDCLFPDCPVQPEAWYLVAAKIITKSKDCPHFDEAQQWIQVINQDYNDWELPVKFSVDEAIQLIEATSIDYISKNEDRAISWLSELIGFLSKNVCFQQIIEKRAILPSQNGILRSFHGSSSKNQQQIHRDGDIDEILKDICIELGDDLRDNLLHKQITHKLSWIPVMQVENIFINLEILLHRIERASTKLDSLTIQSAHELSLLFYDQPDTITTKMTYILKKIHPSIESHPISAESFKVYPRSFFLRWSMKLLLTCIGMTVGVENKEVVHVDQLLRSYPLIVNIYNWINDIIYLLEEYNLTNLLDQYRLIPLQNGQLTSLTTDIWLEDEPTNFENQEISFKKLVNIYVKDNQGNPVDCSNWLVDNRIKCKPSTVRRESVSRLTFMLDSIFKPIVAGSKKDENVDEESCKNWIKLFHQLDIWCSNHPDQCNLFPILTANRDLLMAKAYGFKGSQIALAVINSGKSWETIDRLINLKLNIDFLESLDEIIIENGQEWLQNVIERKDEVDVFLKSQIKIDDLKEFATLLETISVEDLKMKIKKYDSLLNISTKNEEKLVESNDVQPEIGSIWTTKLGSIVENLLYQTFKGYPSFKIERAEIGKDFIISNPHNNQRFSIKICPLNESKHFIRLAKIDALTACVEKMAYTLCSG
uniref:Protein NO VEIN C-terminal domain-containing protein n=1 Tax=Tetranychus urticae TaxID=32264 RepID=T1K7D2_TETUR